MKQATLTAAFVTAFSTSVIAQDFNKGWDAYATGFYLDAAKEWRPLAEQGHARAQFFLGLMYDKGRGVPKDYVEAVVWYRKASKQGYFKAQTKLALKYDRGEGVLQDNIMAHMWYNIGNANGSELGGKNRNIIAQGMSHQSIEKAQEMARECTQSSYEKCGY
ncbi:tetratricopeptide repeat protein [Pseudopelagicola sp. nBUS_19]|uniref:tetratricopeptide repeat protein n=1 Tax=unclassified Pseudopelagicola TaxID=2649563 RepID=UPI003EBD9EC7